MAESTTENLFREFHGASEFVEKRDIPKEFGFRSKRKGSTDDGFPDFFKDMGDWLIVVEAKSGERGPRSDHAAAEADVIGYMTTNAVPHTDILGIALSGQTRESLRVTYFFRKAGTDEIEPVDGMQSLISLDALEKQYESIAHGDPLSDAELRRFLVRLNERFHKDSRVRDTERSLFFSALMIALDDPEFRVLYPVQPKPEDQRTVEARNLNEQIVKAVQRQLAKKVNSYSKRIDWEDRFSFVKTIDIPLSEYKQIIADIDERVYQPSKRATRRDVLGRAYKIFLSRAGKMDNRNIILTPDHIKTFMVDLARLERDDVVLDTCMGSGGFLMDAMEQLVEKAQGDEQRIENIHDHQLIGMELDPVLFALACSNMFLHGDGRSNLLFRDSLITRNRSFEVVGDADQKLRKYVKGQKPTKSVINPPYENDNPINFTMSAIEYLDDGGRLIIIMPNNTLSKYANQKAAVEILERARLDFVIDMPQQLFFEQGRGVKTSVFGFTKTTNGHDRDAMVTFVDMEDDGHQVRSGSGRRDTGRWPAIRDLVERAVRDGLESAEARSWRSPIFSDDTFDPRGIIRNPWPQTESHDLESAVAEWQEARAHREEALDRMAQVLGEAGIGGFNV